MTATAAELHDAVVSALTDNGRIEKINAELRQELFNLLTRDYEKPPQNELTRENFLINELIREYLQFNGYSNSLSVFMRETAQPDEPMDRDFLAQSVNIQAHRHIPILYSMTNVGDFADNEEKIVYKEDPTIENNINDNFATRKIDSNNHQKNKSNSVTKVTATPSNQVKQTIVPIDDSDDDESSDGFFEIKGI